MEEIYLDNHSATRPHSCVVDQMASFLKNYWAASSSPHRLGEQSQLPLVTSINKLYDLIGVGDSDLFYFSSSGPEAIAQVFFSTYLSHVKETGRTHFVATDLEEAPILLCMKRMEKFGCSAKTLPVNSFGQITKEILEEGLRARSALLSFSWANGLTGVIHPLGDLAEVCKKKEVLLHVDASNMIGKHYFRFQDLGVDIMTFDGTLLHAPRGSAGTFVKAGSPFSPFALGASTEPVAALLAIAESVEISMHNFDHVCTETARLRDKLEKNIARALPEVLFPFSEAERLPNTTVMCFPGVVNEALLYLLNNKGVFASMGGGQFQKLSHLLQLCKIEKALSFGALSFSLSFETTESQVNKASEIIIDCYRNLKSHSGSLTRVVSDAS
jgi:cysteine desulfurase